MIRLSPTAIKDYLKCSKMFFYRRAFPEESVTSQEAAVGTIVHKVAETIWKDPNYEEQAAKLISQYDIDLTGQGKIYACLNNIRQTFGGFLEMMTDSDLIEHEFNVKLNKEVSISGKMDRVIPTEDTVIDWKTGTTKRDISNDIQFIIYYWAYQKIFEKTPKVYQVNVARSDFSLFWPRKVYVDTLFDSIIPKMVDSIKKNKYYKEGYYNGGCYRCNFIGVCSRDP